MLKQSQIIIVQMLIIYMNKNKLIYPTQVPQNDDINKMKENFDKFKNIIDLKIKNTIVLNKNIIAKQSSYYAQKIIKIKQNSQKYINKIQQQQKQIHQKIENHMKIDISKWDEYRIFFKDIFQKLQENIQKHRQKNNKYTQIIKKKKIELKLLLTKEKKIHSRVSSLIKYSQQKQSLKSTHQSSRITDRNTHKHRVKTQSSLPALKYFNQFQHLKSIKTQYYDQQDTFMDKNEKKTLSYMQPTGFIKKQEESSFPLLIDLILWYKRKIQQKDMQDSWFLKIIFNKRHFQKLLSYMKNNSSKRRIKKRNQ